MNYTYKLSICMMVRDEETNIKRCLESLKPIMENNFAELIVIDTGSIDATPQIVKEYTNKLYFHPWNDNFSDMRNLSISYAKGEWIFIIDGDERLDSPNELIKLFLKNNLKKYNTIHLYVKNLTSITNEDDYYQNISPRIFRNDGNFYYIGSVHNQPVIKEPSLNVDASLTHYGYISNDRELMEKKFNRTVALLKKELEKNSDNIYYQYQLGVSYDMHNDYKEALREFRRAYELLSKESFNTRKNYIYVYGAYIRKAYLNNEFEVVNKVGKEGINLNKEYIDFYFVLALTSKQLHNQKSLIYNCTEYAKLYKSFNSLSISKDSSVVMYHMDDKSRDVIYSELAQFYINENELDKAYDYIKDIKSKNQNTYLTIKMLVKKYDFKSLKEYYLNIQEYDQKECFLMTLEEEIKDLPEDKKFVLYNEFICIDDSYGIFCKYRLNPSNDNISDYLKCFDFNTLPLFYVEVLLGLKYNLKTLISILKPLSISKTRNIINYLINKDVDFITCFEEYLQSENIRPTDMQTNKTYIAIAAVMLINYSDTREDIDNIHYNLFKLYIDKGINYVSQIYQIQKARIIYNDIVNDEDRFFVLMHITNENLQKDNLKLAVSYLTEALRSYKFMGKYVSVYKDEVLQTKQ